MRCSRQNQAATFEHRGREGPDFPRQWSLGQQTAEASLGRLGGQHFGQAQPGESTSGVAQDGQQLLVAGATLRFAEEAEVFFAVR